MGQNAQAATIRLNYLCKRGNMGVYGPGRWRERDIAGQNVAGLCGAVWYSLPAHVYNVREIKELQAEGSWRAALATPLRYRAGD